MGNYSDREGSVRIDFFKESGKWSETEAVDMEGFYFGSEETAKRCSAGHSVKYKAYLLPDAIIEAMRADPGQRRADGTLRHSGMWAVCIEPYHEFAHPQMFKVPER